MFYLAFLFGLFGSLHCLGMCSPILWVVNFSGSRLVKTLQISLYFIGKTLSYIVLGFLFALLGKGLFLYEFQQNLSIIIGVIMFIFGAFMALKIEIFSVDKYFFLGLNQLKQFLGTNLHKKGLFSKILLGFFNGFLPCGLVYGALFSALATQNMSETIIYMIFFGLGTIPLMVLSLFLKKLLNAKLSNLFRKVIPFFVIFVGLMLIFRGLGFGGSMFSPSKNNLQVQENPDCVTPIMQNKQSENQ